MTASQRFGACAFALGSIVFIGTIASYALVYGSPEGSGPDDSVSVADSAAHMLENGQLIRTIWIVEVLAIIAHAVGGFLLPTRAATKDTLAPAGWLLLGIGSTVYLSMYATMLGAYWPGAEVASTTPSLLESANEQAVAMFLIANLPINLGLMLVYIAEARNPDRVIPIWVAWVAALFAAIVLAVMFYALASQGGMAQVMVAAPAAGLLFVISGVFGIRMALRP